ncbi:MAG: choice-of-anchor D domain-containing protein [Candidatus Eiseniibacteriota bacterium]
MPPKPCRRSGRLRAPLRRGIPGVVVLPSILSILAAGLLSEPASAVRIVNYNLLNWSATSGPARVPYMRAIMRGTTPDIVVSQEMIDQGGVDLFRDQVLNVLEPGQWASAPFSNGPDTDNACFFRTSKFTFLDKVEVATALRNATRYHLRLAGYTSAEAEVYVYSFHLKASDGTTEQQQRLAEMQLIRANAETLPFGSHVLMCGDYNVYFGAEPAFQYALSSVGSDIGRMKDPINQIGNWHDNPIYASVHTQSPRTLSFGGGATGGMDDRFDFILTSYNWDDDLGMELLENTYRAYGQDGLHLNVAISAPPANAAVGQAMADSLMQASDHIPVMADIRVPARMDVPLTPIAFGTVIVGATAEATLTLSNPASLPGETLSGSFDPPVGFSAPGGGFVVPAGTTSGPQTIAMDTATPGNKAGDLGIFSNAPDNGGFAEIALSGTVLAHAAASSESLVVTVLDTLDFGEQLAGGFNDQTGRLYNPGSGPLQARLQVAGATLTGGAGRFTLVEPFVAALVELDPAAYDVHFDDAGATADSTYEATLVFDTADEPGIPGATPLADVTFVLRARVSGGVVSVDPGPDADGVPAAIAFLPPSPNPSAGAVRFRFDLPKAGHVELAIYDVTGRRVAMLGQGGWPAGAHSLTWDGRDSQGMRVANGVYFAHFLSGDLETARRFVRMR